MKSLATLIATVGLVASLGAAAQDRTVSIGSSMPVTDGQRTIVINPDTKSVNVNEDEVVKFVAGGASFAWRFDGTGTRPFNLQQVAPAGALANPVTVYVRQKKDGR